MSYLKNTIIGGKRDCRKTTSLIIESNDTRAPILCSNYFKKRLIKQMARELDLCIPTPISVSEIKQISLKRTSYKEIDEILIDDVEEVLRELLNMNIRTMSSSLSLIELKNNNLRFNNPRYKSNNYKFKKIGGRLNELIPKGLRYSKFFSKIHGI